MKFLWLPFFLSWILFSQNSDEANSSFRKKNTNQHLLAMRNLGHFHKLHRDASLSLGFHLPYHFLEHWRHWSKSYYLHCRKYCFQWLEQLSKNLTETLRLSEEQKSSVSFELTKSSQNSNLSCLWSLWSEITLSQLEFFVLHLKETFSCWDYSRNWIIQQTSCKNL